MKKKFGAVVAGVLVAGLALSGCSANAEYQDRKDKQSAVTLETSLGTANLTERLTREEDPSAIRYLYLMSFGEIIGYYVTKGKISSSAGQLAPEQEIVQPWAGGDRYVVDSAKDDGTFGPGDPGIFFFTTDGVMVETSLDYIQSDAPLSVDVPRLGGSE